MIRHSTVKAIIYHYISDVNASGEDLVQMSSHLMGGCLSVICMSEVKEVQCTIHVMDVIVEITTHNDRSICILLNDILDDISHSLRSLCFERFIPWFEVAIKYLHFMLASYQSHPTEICSQRFDKRQFDFVCRCCPCATIPLQQRLVGPVIVKVHWSR